MKIRVAQDDETSACTDSVRVAGSRWRTVPASNVAPVPREPGRRSPAELTQGAPKRGRRGGTVATPRTDAVTSRPSQSLEHAVSRRIPAILLALSLAAPAAAQSPFSFVKWRSIGPVNTSGRIDDITVGRTKGEPDAI